MVGEEIKGKNKNPIRPFVSKGKVAAFLVHNATVLPKIKA